MKTAYNPAERKDTHTRLRQLTNRWLLTPDVTELEQLSAALRVPLRWRRYDLAGGKCVALGRRVVSVAKLVQKGQ